MIVVSQLYTRLHPVSFIYKCVVFTCPLYASYVYGTYMIFSPTMFRKITHHVKQSQWILLAGQTNKINLAKSRTGKLPLDQEKVVR